MECTRQPSTRPFCRADTIIGDKGPSTYDALCTQQVFRDFLLPSTPHLTCSVTSTSRRSISTGLVLQRVSLHSLSPDPLHRPASVLAAASLPPFLLFSLAPLLISQIVNPEWPARNAVNSKTRKPSAPLQSFAL